MYGNEYEDKMLGFINDLKPTVIENKISRVFLTMTASNKLYTKLCIVDCRSVTGQCLHFI